MAMGKHRIKGPYEAFFKRFIDIAASVLFLLLFGWLYLQGLTERLEELFQMLCEGEP